MRQRRSRREKDNERYGHNRKWVGVHGKRGIGLRFKPWRLFRWLNTEILTVEDSFLADILLISELKINWKAVDIRVRICG
jgi:hypothetical protein